MNTTQSFFDVFAVLSYCMQVITIVLSIVIQWAHDGAPGIVLLLAVFPFQFVFQLFIVFVPSAIIFSRSNITRFRTHRNLALAGMGITIINWILVAMFIKPAS